MIYVLSPCVKVWLDEPRLAVRHGSVSVFLEADPAVAVGAMHVMAYTVPSGMTEATEA
jgi:hypothetical protein